MPSRETLDRFVAALPGIRSATRVVLVEDDAPLQRGLAASLREAGHDVFNVCDAHDLMRALRAIGAAIRGGVRCEPDLVLMDAHVFGLAEMEALDYLAVSGWPVRVILINAIERTSPFARTGAPLHVADLRATVVDLAARPHGAGVVQTR